MSFHGRVIGLKKSIVGNDNEVIIKNATVTGATIRIRGNGNRLIIEDDCIIGDSCSFWLEGVDNCIIIGKGTTMTSHCHLNAQERGTRILLGEDCMLSNRIVIRTSDAHPIYQANVRINPAQDVIIGRHVWIAPGSTVLKGAVIGDGCIVGSHSLVNKTIPANSLVVGMPARVVKEDILWTREDVIMKQ